MTYIAYKQSIEIGGKGYDFYALIMAAMCKEDTGNIEKLKSVFPEVWEELRSRCSAPDGCLTSNEFRIFSNVPNEIKEEYLGSLKFPND